MNLLWADFHKISENILNAETNITALQGEVRQLKQQTNKMSVLTSSLDARVEDAEGRTRRNLIRPLGFPKRAEGMAVESFWENWM